MKAYYVYPEDLEVGQFSATWRWLCAKLGYDYKQPPGFLLLMEIKATQ